MITIVVLRESGQDFHILSRSHRITINVEQSEHTGPVFVHLKRAVFKLTALVSAHPQTEILCFRN